MPNLMSDPAEHLLNHFLRNGEPLHVAIDGLMRLADSGPAAHVLLPGSFDPVHRGHWQLAQIAEELIGHRAAFELSVINVDNPMLTREEIRRRLAQFAGLAPAWL